MSLELSVQKRNTLFTSSLVSNRIRKDDFIHDGSIVKGDGQGVSDESLVGIMVLGGELFIFDALDLRKTKE